LQLAGKLGRLALGRRRSGFGAFGCCFEAIALALRIGEARADAF